jgi:HK97 family phage portal protein
VRLPFGYQISRTKAAVEPMTAQNASALTPSSGGWWPLIREPFTGAWQKNMEVSVDHALTYTTVFACVTQKASDIAKLWINLVQEDADGICTPTENSAYSPVLREPNHYQTPYEFVESWNISILTRGNTYVLKERDARGVVRALYVLDPQRVQVLVAPDGSIYYGLATDYLSGVDAAGLTVPASEIIHDKTNTFYHPLCGISALVACGLAVMQGKRIQTQSEAFFRNNSQPGGLLMTANPIGPETQKAILEHWEANYAGQDNVGRIAVLGGGLTYTPLTPVSARDAQLIEQLNFTAIDVCSAFRMPPYKVGVGPVPVHNKPQDLAVEYYEQSLQADIERIEQVFSKGIGLLGTDYSIEFDLDALLRMDTATATTASVEAIKGGLMTPNEGRKRFDLKPVPGGDSVFMQQQQFSLEALAQRDQNNPFPQAPTSPTPAAPAAPANDQPPAADAAKDFETEFSAALFEKAMAEGWLNAA